ncbi:unnamed protein product [Mycena citricolor]|uniref:Uncharacterized protein n=1 Tax=Mycena citricolor TaxID=2018698 RepID=A0AAD2Q338_9AGAR|nr:unnamed protein product [Mycena citricolor]
MLLARTALLLLATVTATANAQNTKQGLLDFYATQTNLEDKANLFAAQNYGKYAQPNVTQLQNIANHIKNCSDALDLATISVTGLIPRGLNFPLIDAPAQDTINKRFIPPTQKTITGHLRKLLKYTPFYDDVQASPAMKIKICHWVGGLAYQNLIFLGLMGQAAPIYTDAWTQLQTEAASVYSEFLGDIDGFACDGL